MKQTMKKINLLLSLVLLLGISLDAQAWGRREHAAVAYIAEQHLTPEAKATVNEILGGRTMVYYASWLDTYKKEMMLKIDKPYKDTGKCERTIPHTFKVTKNLKPRYQKYHEGLYIIEQSIEQLKDYRNLDDSTRMTAMQCLIHLVGDVHCPGHVIFADGRDKGIGKFDVTFFKKKTTMHKIWDSGFMNEAICGGVMDMAYMVDRANEKQIAEIQAGTVRDWGQDIIDRTKDMIWDVEEDAALGKDYLTKYRDLGFDQIQRAGLRLAKVMNDLFTK